MSEHDPGAAADVDDAGVVRLRMPAELDAAVAAPTVRRARDLLRRPGVDAVVVDMAAVEFVDSLGIGLLVDLRALADDRGAAFSLHNVPPRAASIIRLTGLLDHLGAQ